MKNEKKYLFFKDDKNLIELELLSNLVADYDDEHFTGKSEPTLKVAREISRKLNIDANIVLGV